MEGRKKRVCKMNAQQRRAEEEEDRPPLLLRSRLLRHDLRREQLVVPEVKVVLRFLMGDLDLVQPLDAATTDLTRDDESNGEACEE
jgi:hypothetical protein